MMNTRTRSILIGWTVALALTLAAGAWAGVALTQTVSSGPGASGTWTSSTATMSGRFNVSVSGTWVGTVTLQRSYDGTNWMDVATFTANIETVADEPGSGVYWRLGIKNGEYTSGSAVLRLSK